MGAGRGRWWCALGGGVSLGVGTIAYAFFSPASVGCSTNLVVLTRGTVTARGCAAYSVVAHVGVGLIVLGAVLLMGSFALAVRNRRQVAAGLARTGEVSAPVAVSSGQAPEVAPAPAPTTTTPPSDAPVPPLSPAPLVAPAPTFAPAAEPVRTAAEPVRTVPVAPEPVVARTRPIAPGEDVYDDEAYVDRPDEQPGGGQRLLGSAVQLPPGWYGNPDNPGGAVQWWDGTKLTDRPG